MPRPAEAAPDYRAADSDDGDLQLNTGAKVYAGGTQIAPTTGTETSTLTNKIIQLTAAHGSDNTYQGVQIAGLNAGATISQFDAVYISSLSKLLLADANGSGTFPARGLAVAAYVDTDPAKFLTYGTVRHDAWNWTPGGAIYLSATAGGLTQTVPAVSGDNIQVVGYALTADIAFFDFNSNFVTLT